MGAEASAGAAAEPASDARLWKLSSHADLISAGD